MDSNTQGFTSYWRNTLADAESGRGAFDRDEVDSFTKWIDITSGRLDEQTVRAFFEGENDTVRSVAVLLRPQVWVRLSKHGKVSMAGAPGVVTPLVIYARVSREGFLFPTASAAIPRDLLDPLPNGTFSIGDIEHYDKYKTTNYATTFCGDNEPEQCTETDEQRAARHIRYHELWNSYLEESAALLMNVAGEWVTNHEEYEPAAHGYVIKAGKPGGASLHILPMYDHLLSCKKEVPLLSRFASQESPPLEPLLPGNAMFSMRMGHSGDKFPLAEAQRDALSHYLTQQPGDILAVNGPPGTGKTTLLLSVIATEWVNAALNKTEPPVVIATSTNNQAVTNIIEAFGKDFATGSGVMAGRWLPEVTSFGAYYPSLSRKAEAEKKYQTDDFFTHIESHEYVDRARSVFLEKASEAFPDKECGSPEEVIDLLHERLTERHERLKEIESAWDTLNRIRQERDAISENLQQYIQEQNALLVNSSDELALLKEGKKQWQQYRANESLIYAFFSWIPGIQNKRRYQINIFMDDTFGPRMTAFSGTVPDDIDAWIERTIAQAEKEQGVCQRQLDVAHDVLRREAQALQQWRSLSVLLGHDGEDEISLARADELADTQIRFPAFQLATHYWEGRWLMDMSAIKDLQDEKGRNGAKIVQARWQRRMKLTPCVVMTCYMLPQHMKIGVQDAESRKYADSYYYNFADLLIVDEAGQVLPEVAAASFALAKKALVIGDTAQLSPVWSSLPVMDMGNMLEQNLISGSTHEALKDAYSVISDSGKSAASGSVMKVAQFNSRYQYDPNFARGMYLYEHRRCFDNIISYCNALCYEGKLLPKRGNENSPLFPSLGYLHIDGKGVQASNKSRFNLLEAETIAAWLAAHKQKIERYYGKALHQIVGIVTPFSAQVNHLKKALQSKDINCSGDDNPLTVGTVHTLQGAERPIVLFSPVYSKHADGRFMDKYSNILNVVVSRAKDSFLVFGDMDLFEIQAGSSPRGLLAKYLFASADNQLQFETQLRDDLNTDKAPPLILHGVEQHDAFLNQTFEDVGNSITIVSPWLNWNKLEETGFVASMRQARTRGVDITVVTDKASNIQHTDPEKRREKKYRLNEAVEKLNEMGIVTKLVSRVHSKIVIGDEGLLCVGSFNWFSAARDARYPLYDTSMVYSGEIVKGEIKAIYSILEQRQIL